MDWPLSLIRVHPSAHETGSRDHLPRDMVTGAWASPVKCIYQRGLQWKSLHRNFPFMLSDIFMIGITNGVPSLLIQTEFCFRDDTTPWLHTTLKFKILWTCSAGANILFTNYACGLDNSNLYVYLSQPQNDFTSSFRLVHYTLQFCGINLPQTFKTQSKMLTYWLITCWNTSRCARKY
jgi:hypothetical protein